jgi:hypothetical protein
MTILGLVGKLLKRKKHVPRSFGGFPVSSGPYAEQISHRYQDKDGNHIHFCVIFYKGIEKKKNERRAQINFWNYTTNSGWEKVVPIQ